MRILVIGDRLPSRRLGDGLRLFGLLTPLCDRHRFDLLCFARPGDQVEPEATRLFTSIRTFPFPEPKRAGIATRLGEAFRLGNFKAHTAEMRAAITADDSEGRYDLVLDVSANMLLCLPAGGLRTPLVVDSIDEPLLRDCRAMRRSRPSQWPRLLRQLLMYWRYERRMLANASVNVYASDVDAEFYLRFFPGRRVAAVPNGVDLDYFQRLHSEDHLESESIVFEGSMMFPPNVDAAIRLCRDVLPRVKLQRPRARVILVGRDPVPAVRALAGEDVDVTGTVLDVRPYLACAAVFACPMELGSGIKNKILQAWASGLPVVATPESVGGLAARDGENILVRRSVADFAAAVIELLQDRERAAQLGRGGRKTVEREYSWRHSSESFERLLHQAFTG